MRMIVLLLALMLVLLLPTAVNAKITTMYRNFGSSSRRCPFRPREASDTTTIADSYGGINQWKRPASRAFLSASYINLTGQSISGCAGTLSKGMVTNEVFRGTRSVAKRS
ncbi:MAG: hypothetical protein AB7O68_09320 [Pirellulales bacterium]